MPGTVSFSMQPSQKGAIHMQSGFYRTETQKQQVHVALMLVLYCVSYSSTCSKMDIMSSIRSVNGEYTVKCLSWENIFFLIFYFRIEKDIIIY